MGRGFAAPTIYRCYDSPAHGFTAVVRVACRQIAGLIRKALEGLIARAVG